MILQATFPSRLTVKGLVVTGSHQLAAFLAATGFFTIL